MDLTLPLDIIFRLPVDGKFVCAKLHYWKLKTNKRGYDAWVRFNDDESIPPDMRGLEFPSLNSATRALKSSNKRVLSVWYIKEDGLYNRSLDMVKDNIKCDVVKTKFEWSLSKRSKEAIKSTKSNDRSHHLYKKHPNMGALIQTYVCKGTKRVRSMQKSVIECKLAGSKFYPSSSNSTKESSMMDWKIFKTENISGISIWNDHQQVGWLPKRIAGQIIDNQIKSMSICRKSAKNLVLTITDAKKFYNPLSQHE